MKLSLQGDRDDIAEAGWSPALRAAFTAPTPPSHSDTPPTSVKPQRTALASVHPNPFNPQTTIAFDLNVSAHVRLEIYNSRGEHVRTLLNETRGSGRHELIWNGRDLAGRAAASGVYFAQLSAGGVRDRRKMVLLK